MTTAAPEQRHKKANDPVRSLSLAVQDAAVRRNQQAALKELGRFMATGLGVGMAGRGLLGMTNLLRKNLFRPEVTAPLPAVVQIPYRTDEEEEKLGVDGANGGWLDKPLAFAAGEYSTEGGASMPWVLPAMVGGGAASAFGGWKLMDYILDRQRRKALDDEVARAKKEFNDALLSQYDNPKQASILSKELDGLYDDMTKAAASVPDWAGLMTGMYGTAGGVAGLLAGVGTYNLLKKFQRREMLRKAQQRRMLRMYQQRPTELFAQPVAVPSKQPSEDEQLDSIGA